jgi:redox-sensitive bicupin YhaK (pirin superfamily)
MEILSYVVDGRLAHKDSMGEAHELGPNEVQAMSAGNGVIHSEYNASETEPTHFLQIWIMPAEKNIEPSYQQFAYDPAEKRGRLRLMAGPDPQGGAARINQDARMYATVLAAGESVTAPIAGGRSAWIQCVTGNAEVNGLAIKAGDGVAVSDEAEVVLRGADSAGAELLLFDLA